MIPDNVEKIIMTKEDYDRNVEQLLYDKVNAELEVERLNNIINELLKYIEEKAEENDDNTMISKSYKFALYDILGKLQELKGSDKE